MVLTLIGFVIGFIAGALVFRNNASKGEAIVVATEAKAKEIATKSKNK